MGKINVLSFAVANLIAAGEVVDRPASAVKELVENAIDSGASRITVEIQNGGVSFIRVCDNGCGMEPDDLPIAVRRHATSKIKTAEDLESVGTLGFRGEALAAIASVSNMRIISKTAGAQYGAMLEISAGNIVALSERACATGTTVIVEDLFANVPARRKFLKRDVTEAAAVSVIVERVALTQPSISFAFISDGAMRFQTAGDGNLKNAVYAVFGREFASKLISVSSELEGVSVNGFIGRSDNFKANRNYQNFFINRRYVKSKTASAAIEQAYSSYIPSEKYPVCVINIGISPKAVDVNVHPAKLEVKFSSEKPVFDAIYYTVRSALEQDVTRPAFRFDEPKKSEPKSQPKFSGAFVPVEELRGRQENLKIKFPEPKMSIRTRPNELQAQTASALSAPIAPSPKASGENVISPMPRPENKVQKNAERITPKSETLDAEPTPQTEAETMAAESVATPKPQAVHRDYRILGEAFHSYVFVECDDRVIVIDKHAAHERILFEELRAHLDENESSSQLLMLPIEVMLTTEELSAIEDYRAEIEKVGFRFVCKKHLAEITALPTGIGAEAASDMFIEFADRILDRTGSIDVSRRLIFERALYQASCKAAIKAGREYPPEYVKLLVEKLMRLPDITFCPHGRPIAVEMTKNELDKQFERK